MTTCGGACCAVFPYSVSLVEVQRRADQGSEQHQILAGMLVPLAPAEAVARAERFGTKFVTDRSMEEVAAERELFTCAHWDEETRLCGIYDDRPRMCRDYPYDGRCTAHCECSYTAPMNIISDYAASRVRHLNEKSPDRTTPAEA